MIILIDNYDSFTWNLWHFLSDLGAEVKIIRNDAMTVADILAMQPAGLVLSPGPGIPSNAGILEPLITAALPDIPILGVCLGHQAICTALGGKIAHITPMHGKLSRIYHHNTDLFDGIEQGFVVTRYHSLVIDQDNLPDALEPTAHTEDKQIMAIQHKTRPVFGVQFHPESIASAAGYRLLAHFLSITGQNNLPDEQQIKQLESQLLQLDKRFPDHVHV